ncbi:MAG: hypothetical protein HYR96_12990 [Deltaproteobacteria bacterium]|nr:hypothetical protein [Deltaproteobacteria bacterium]MBI3295813.1 hypothetical protein [Deltaproteobacteria bacterium]
MTRSPLYLLALALATVWACALRLPGYFEGPNLAIAWIGSLDLVAALIAVFAAQGAIFDTRTWTTLETVLLSGLAIVAFETEVPRWLAWWNVGLAISAGAYTLSAVIADKRTEVSPFPGIEEPHQRAA